MKRAILACVLLVLVSLACGQYVATPTAAAPSLSPTVPPSTATAEPTATAAVAETEAPGDVAIVRQVSVNVRDAAGGDPTGEYVFAGQEVTVLETATDEEGNEWVRIAEPPGWVFAGCLEGSERGCTAK